jgi:hypothetical protein
MNEWKTPKGTTLYLLDLKGKPYLPVAERLIWFREEHPDWSIETEFLQRDGNASLAKATIRNAEGRQIANAHKLETKSGFADFIEKSETSAVGRALALIGYGTQFCANELNEGERLADAPRNEPADFQPVNQSKPLPTPTPQKESSPGHPGDVVMPFGKTKGSKLSDLTVEEISSAISWLKFKAKPDFRDSAKMKEFLFWAEQYLRKAPPTDELDQALAGNKPTTEDLQPPDWVTEEIPF